MANRAYLYASDCDPNNSHTWVSLDRNSGRRYYDSRHNFPLAWFFFFRPSAVKLISVSGSGETWEEAKLIADRQQSVRYFASKQSLLSEIVGPIIGSNSIEQFVETIEKWPGDCLMVDPYEVLVDDDQDAVRIKRILEIIGEDSPNLASLEEMLHFYTSIKFSSEYEAKLNVLGATYG